MPYYPIFIDLQGEKVVVVGGGTVAERKIETLLEYGAVVSVVSRELTPPLRKYVEEGKIKFLEQEFRENQLKGAFMVIAATDDSLLNHQVSKIAREKGLLINAVDQPSDCNFIVPSILRRGDLSIAVSTSGKSPALAKKIREELENSFGDEYGILLALMGRLRKEILSRGFSQAENSRLFRELVDSDILEAIGRKDWNEVSSVFNRILHTQFLPDNIITWLRDRSTQQAINTRE